MTSNITTESTPSISSNSPTNSPLNSPSIISSTSSSSATINGNNMNESQNHLLHLHHPSSPPSSSSSSTPTPHSNPQSDIDDVIDPSTNNTLVDNARSAASISNLINHDEEQLINTTNPSTTPKSQSTSQISSRSISPIPETPTLNDNNEQNLKDIDFNKKKRKGDDENDIDNNGDFDSSKRQRCNLKNPSSSGEGNSDEIIKINNNDSVPPSPVTSSGFDEIMLDDHNSDEYSGANSPTNSSISGIGGGSQITSSSSIIGNNINFVTKQTRKKPYIPRPPNSFILYRQHHHPLILNQHPGINNSEISRIIADHWRNLPNQEKDEWKRKAEEAKQRHMKAWPDYKYQPRRRVVGPTFKKPIKGPDTPTTKSDFSAQEGMMDNFVIELSPRKVDRNENIMESRERPRFQRNSVIIIEGGSKELKDRNGNNGKPSPAEAIKAKLGTSFSSSHSSHVSQRLPPPSTLVPQQQPPVIIHSTTTPSTPTVSTSPCGALIVLEGSENSTTLQSNQLYEFLKNEGIKAKLWKFPDTSTPSGNALKTYQSTNRQPHPKTLHLLIAAHWWELMPIMKEQLMDGITLIVDRYVYSAIAESVAAGLDLLWCKSSYSQVLSPDLIFFLNVEQEVNEMDKQQLSPLSLPHVNDVLGIGNNDSDDGRFAWQRRMQDALTRLAEVQWKILDARKSNKIINAQIISASIEVIERCRKSNTSYNNMYNNTIMSHQNQQLPPLVPASSQQSQYPPANSPPPNHSLLTLSQQQQQNQNVLPPIGRHDFSRPVHVKL